MFKWLLPQEGEELDLDTGLPKFLIERQEKAYIQEKLLKEGRYDELENLEKRNKTEEICYESAFRF